jgi:branched-chain amino acid transport system ATP-binding protein
MSETLLDVRCLTSGYGKTPIVRDISLTVDAGEVVVLLGPNGAGKSTTLRAISNLLPAMKGEVVFRGESRTKLAPHLLARSGLAHLPEGRGIFYGLTVAEHFGLQSRRAGAKDFARALQYFPELGRLEKRIAGQLSGGEQQMLALARTLARAPRLLLIDELSLGLAPRIVERLMPVLRDYADDAGAGVLLVEQHVDLALSIADRGYVLTHGSIGPAKSSADLREHHDEIVARYLGLDVVSGSGGAAPVRQPTPTHIEGVR